MVITSLENKEIKKYASLLKKKYRDQGKLFMVEGEHLVEEALKSNLLEKVILLENSNLSFDTDTIYVTKEIMKKLSTLDTPPNIIGICKMIPEKDDLGNRVLALDDIQDPGNLGTIIRSAVAFNIDSIIMSLNTVDLYNPKVIRSTQGMLFHINIIKSDLKKELTSLKQKNYSIYTTDVTDGCNIKEVAKEDKLVLVMGNEGNGVSKEISSLADKKIYIKTNPLVESLNVGVATSILLYELGS